MKVKLFVALEIQHLELRVFPFNLHVYYVARGFIVSTRAFNLLTRAFNFPTRAFNLPTRAFNLPTRAFNLRTLAFNLRTRGFNLPTRVFTLLARGFELVTRRFELLARIFEPVTREFELVTRNSCFTFPQNINIKKIKNIRKSLQRQFWGIHFLIAFVKALKLENSLSSFQTKSQIFVLRWDKLSVPWKVLFTFGTENSEAWRKLYWTLRFEENSLKMVGARYLLSIYYLV